MKRTTELGRADTTRRAELCLELAPAGWMLSTLHHFFPLSPVESPREEKQAWQARTLRGRNTDSKMTRAVTRSHYLVNERARVP